MRKVPLALVMVLASAGYFAANAVTPSPSAAGGSDLGSTAHAENIYLTCGGAAYWASDADAHAAGVSFGQGTGQVTGYVDLTVEVDTQKRTVEGAPANWRTVDDYGHSPADITDEYISWESDPRGHRLIVNRINGKLSGIMSDKRLEGNCTASKPRF